MVLMELHLSFARQIPSISARTHLRTNPLHRRRPISRGRPGSAHRHRPGLRSAPSQPLFSHLILKACAQRYVSRKEEWREMQAAWRTAANNVRSAFSGAHLSHDGCSSSQLKHFPGSAQAFGPSPCTRCKHLSNRIARSLANLVRRSRAACYGFSPLFLSASEITTGS